MKRIETDRRWDLEIIPDKAEEDSNMCIEIRERHEDAEPSDRVPYIVIPVESINQLIIELLKAKEKYDEILKEE